MEQTPVSLRESLEEFADFEVVASHGTDQGHQFFANIFGHRFLIDLAGKVIATLRGVLVKRALEEVERLVDLALELLLAELKKFGLPAHRYAYIYAYYSHSKTAESSAKG